MNEDIVRVKHRMDLDVPRSIRSEVYTRLTSEVDMHRERIAHMIAGVETLDGSSAHLEFCFTGYYMKGDHFVCATWPRHPELVQFSLHAPSRFESLFPGRVVLYVNSDPKQVDHAHSYRFGAASSLYLFFGMDPHLPHRPYLFSRFDGLFSREQQDDEQVISYHLPALRASWNESKDSIEQGLQAPSVSDLESLEKIVRSISTILNKPNSVVVDNS